MLKIIRRNFIKYFSSLLFFTVLTLTKVDFFFFVQALFLGSFFIILFKYEDISLEDLKHIAMIFISIIVASFFLNIFVSDMYINNHLNEKLPINVNYFYILEFTSLCLFYFLLVKIKYKFPKFLLFIESVRNFNYKNIFFIFLFWLVLLRPLGFFPLDFFYEHDVYNFHRLIFLYIPHILILFSFPFIIQFLNKYEFFIFITFFIYFVFFIIFSFHSEPSIWWSRRYFASALPLTLLIPLFIIKYKVFKFDILKIIFLFFLFFSIFVNFKFFYFDKNLGVEDSVLKLTAYANDQSCENLLFIEDNTKPTEALGQFISSVLPNKKVFTNFVFDPINKDLFNNSCLISSFMLSSEIIQHNDKPDVFSIPKYSGTSVIYFREFFRLYYKRDKKIKNRTYYFYSLID